MTSPGDSLPTAVTLPDAMRRSRPGMAVVFNDGVGIDAGPDRGTDVFSDAHNVSGHVT